MSMVERVAEALWNCEGAFFEEPEDTIKAARAAIAAMREPTSEMFYVLQRYIENEDLWRELIDTALEPVDDDVDGTMGEKSK